jgi:t-SNARE complex subunit (syntaxin)
VTVRADPDELDGRASGRRGRARYFRAAQHGRQDVDRLDGEMQRMNDFLDKAKDLVSDNKDKVKDGIDKATEVVKEKAGDKAGLVEQAAEKAKDAVDGL